MAGRRILFAGGGTGGHLYPALNIAAALRRLDPDTRCFFLGSERGVEASVLPDTGYPYRLLPFQPIHRSRVWRNWRLVWTAPAVATGVARAFRAFRPELAVGTGGYVSGPALVWARLTGCRTALQEQNARPGLVTRLLSRHVDQIHLGYPEALSALAAGPRASVHVFGNPVPPPDGPDGTDGHAWPPGRVVLVVGGSQGARALNEILLADLERLAGRGSAVANESGPRARRGPGEAPAAARPSAPEWPEDLSIVWVAGPAHAEVVARRAALLPWTDRIRVVPFIRDLGTQLGRATLAVARAGAMFTAELCAAGVPVVFVPFPAAAGGHQSANARAMVDAGAAEMREEADLRPGELWGLCRGLLADAPRRRRMARAAKERARPDAAERIAEALLQLVPGPGRTGGTA